MPRGDLVSILDTGPVIRPKPLEAVGIYDSSVCWSIWVRDQKQPMTGQSRSSAKPHLLISPIKPESWPFMFRLQLELIHQKGSLAIATEFLTENDVTITYVEVAPSGYRHATCTFICEALAVRNKMAGPIEFKNGEDREHARHNKNMYEKNIERKFLHEGLFKENYLCSFTESEIGSEHWDTHLDKVVKAVKIRAASNLMFLSRCYDFEKEKPLRFSYDKKSMRLISHLRGGFLRRAEDEGITLPTKGLAAFVRNELYLRIQLLESKEIRGIVFFDVNYDANRVIDEGKVAASSKGLLADLTREIAKSEIDVNILRVTNRTTEVQSDHEQGMVSLVGSAAKLETTELSDLADRFEKAKTRLENLRYVKPRLTPFRDYKIFISMHSNSKRKGDIENCIKSAARKVGIAEENLIQTRTLVKSVTKKVAQNIRQCQGFIQVITEDSLQWLTAEYAMAVALDLVRVRLVSASSAEDISVWRHKLKLEKEKELLPIRLEDDTKNLDHTFEEVFEKITEELTGRSYHS